MTTDDEATVTASTNPTISTCTVGVAILSSSSSSTTEIAENRIPGSHTILLDENEKATLSQVDGAVQTLEIVNDAAACTCIACATTSPSSTICQLYQDGCRECYDLYLKQNVINNLIEPHVDRSSPTRRQCLFRCCAQESRSIKDQYVLKLDRILSLSLAQQSTTITNLNVFTDSRTIHPTDDSPEIEPHFLSNGTDIVCCWHLNGVRTMH